MEKQSKKIIPFIVLLFLGTVGFSQHFQPVWGNQNPQFWMSFVVLSGNIDGINLDANDEIAVFDTDGSGNEVCVGVKVITSTTPPFTFSAGEDDGNGGFTPGDSIIYRLWDSSESKEITLIERSYSSSSDSVYTSGGSAVLNLIKGYSADIWSGSGDSDWNNTANWNTGLIPNAGADVIIPATGVTNYPTLTSSVECNNITIESNSSGDASILGDQYLTINGNSTVQRYITGGKWHDISASANNQTVNSLYFSGNPDVWLRVYNEPDNTRTYITDPATAMPPGAGFEVWVDNGYNVIADFTGPLQTTDLTLTTTTTPALSYTTGTPQSDYGYNLIGNPYASPLDLDNGTWTSTDVSNSFWVWDPGNSSYADYNTVTTLGSLANGIIPMGQGFFIQATGPSPSFTIPMDARVHSTLGYYKNAKVADDTPVHISLLVQTEKGSNETNIAFLEGATEEFDIYDTRKFFSFSGKAPQVYSIQAGEDLGINGLPVIPVEGTEVKIGFKAGTDGAQTLTADLEYLPETTVLLEDLVTGDVQDLVENPVYEFTASVDDDPARFILYFNQTITGNGEKPVETGLQVYAYDGAVYIRSKGEISKEKKEIMIYDMLGREVLKTTAYPAALNRIPFDGIHGYYVVKVKSATSVTTNKIYMN
ncbi:MAG: T9SS type A sorting domain-containing protein [Chlorobi bacterium]|nr:T9SS type A sorting domain-containing protein [Chlorobiota bacterium]